MWLTDYGGSLQRLLFGACSDIVINVDGQSIQGHKFVLRAHTDHWGVDLDTVSNFDLPSGKLSLINLNEICVCLLLPDSVYVC